MSFQYVLPAAHVFMEYLGLGNKETVHDRMRFHDVLSGVSKTVFNSIIVCLAAVLPANILIMVHIRWVWSRLHYCTDASPGYTDQTKNLRQQSESSTFCLDNAMYWVDSETHRKQQYVGSR